MRKIKNLIHSWNARAATSRPVKVLRVKLGARDYARLCALAEIYPGQVKEEILSDLISAALDEVEEAFPYIQGNRVIAEDEFGDPVYEDVGVTPRFEALTHKYFLELEEQ